MTNTATDAALSGKLGFLRATSGTVAVCAVVQPLLALGPLFGTGPLSAAHGSLGMLTVVLGVVAAVASAMWGRASGNLGLLAHGVSVGVLGVVQVGLGEAGVTLPHIVLGFAFLLAAVALFTLAVRKPYGRAVP